MASIIRPALLRQQCSTLTAKRISSSGLFAAPARSPTTTPLTRRPFQSAFVRNALPTAVRATAASAFHTTTRRAILPPPPQKIEGTLNDPVKVPESEPIHGGYHWTFERLVAVGLVPLTIAPFAAGSLNPVLDASLCALLIVHSYVGFQSSIIDYFPSRRTPKTKAILMWVLRGSTVAVGIALYSLETNDVGLTEGIKRIWTA